MGIEVKGVLVIVPCGQGKIWDKKMVGAFAARDVYTGAPFKVNREYAERFADRWFILSAKYGFISPDFMIPEPYNITFKKKSTGPVSISVLQEQIKDMNLGSYDTVIGLGGKEYRTAMEGAFGVGVNLIFPFSGLPLGKAMQATKRTVEVGRPYWQR
ncbi:MAG: DUF6884 domain-containing protein [Mobilitalea sp.]